MPPATQNQVIEQANESAKARASEAVSSEPTMTAPDVSKIEAPAQPLNLPNTQTTVGALEQFTSVTPEMLQQQRELQKSQKEQKNTLEDIYSGLADLGTRGATTIKMEEAAGIPQLNTALIEVENEIASKTLLFRRERERIEQAGGSIAQVNAELQDVGRKQNRELADLETIRAARSNTLTNAQNLINRKIELEFGDKQARIDALKYIYNENKDVLNKAEDRQFQTMLRREERGFEVAKQKFVQLEEEKMKYLTNAAQAGADNNTLKAIQSAQSLDDLYSMPGIQKFALSQAEKLDMAYKNAQISNIYDQINARGVERYEAALKKAQEAKDQADAGLQKSLAGAALALELQTAPGLSAAIGFGVKKNPISRTLAGAATGAGVGAAGGSVVPVIGTIAGGIVGGIAGGVGGFFAGEEAVAGTARADYEAKADQLAAMITLEGRSALRGQGTITDSEQALLARAETILSDKNVSEDLWLDALQQTSQILNLANKRYAEEYGGIPEELGSIYGIGSNGLPIGSEISIDPNGNIVLPAGMTTDQVISDEDFWK